MRESSKPVWFATSNDHKFKEAAVVFKSEGLLLKRLPTKGEEVQSDDPMDIAIHSARSTFEEAGVPVFAEDTGLFLDSLGGFPGPYASYVFRTLGLDGFLRLVPPKGRGAEFVSAVAYCDNDTAEKAFMGRLKGTIAAAPRGTKGFGYNPVFIPLGDSRTLAEFSLSEKTALSHRGKAVLSLAKWLKSR